MIPFSRRLPDDFTPNALARAAAERRARGAPLFDLTESNPTRVGLPIPARAAWQALADGAIAPYEPHAFGAASAREAVRAYFAQRGIELPVARLALTASTSEAYVHLFRMLCDPLDAVLVPEPSYPLFVPLAQLEGVRPIPYPLVRRNGGWEIDLDRLAAAISPAARAIVVVHPNNPTGSLVGTEEAAEIERLCATHDLAIVADEVFADFVYPEHVRPKRLASFAGACSVLTFTLGGVSKTCGLPQAKAAWIAISGPDGEVERARQRLEWVTDAFLSVAPAVQRSLPDLLHARGPFLDAARARNRRNLAALDAALAGAAEVERLPIEGGWSAVLRLPPALDDEAWALRFLEHGVMVQPGHFYDFAEEHHVVVSLLPEPGHFAEAARLLRECLSEV